MCTRRNPAGEKNPAQGGHKGKKMAKKPEAKTVEQLRIKKRADGQYTALHVYGGKFLKWGPCDYKTIRCALVNLESKDAGSRLEENMRAIIKAMDEENEKTKAQIAQFDAQTPEGETRDQRAARADKFFQRWVDEANQKLGIARSTKISDIAFSNAATASASKISDSAAD